MNERIILTLILLLIPVVSMADEQHQMTRDELHTLIIEMGPLNEKTCRPNYEEMAMWTGLNWDKEKKACYIQATSVSNESVRIYMDENWEFTEVKRYKEVEQ